MTPDEYVSAVLRRYVIPTGPYSQAEQNAKAITPVINQWAGAYLVETFFSGSYAKGTGVLGSTDIDIFISLSSSISYSLGQIYNGLFDLASSKGWVPRRQNVSIGVSYNGAKIDLVPGRVQTGYYNYHSLYLNRQDSWTQTNVKLHIDRISQSNRIDEIRAIKIWRNLHNLEFPSFYLELTVLNALSGRSTSNLAQNVLAVLHYLETSFQTARVEDPANTNNIISQDLTAAEKWAIAEQARRSRQASNWEQIIW